MMNGNGNEKYVYDLSHLEANFVCNDDGEKRLITKIDDSEYFEIYYWSKTINGWVRHDSVERKRLAQYTPLSSAKPQPKRVKLQTVNGDDVWMDFVPTHKTNRLCVNTMLIRESGAFGNHVLSIINASGGALQVYEHDSKLPNDFIQYAPLSEPIEMVDEMIKDLGVYGEHYTPFVKRLESLKAKIQENEDNA